MFPAQDFRGQPSWRIVSEKIVFEARTWMHIDLYGWNGKERPGRPVGAEPQAMRALYAFIKQHAR